MFLLCLMTHFFLFFSIFLLTNSPTSNGTERNGTERKTKNTKFICQYSGGQESVGQGGFYASGGARAADTTTSSSSSSPTIEESRMSMLALAADVQKISSVMKELETLENLLAHDKERDGGGGGETVSGRSIEIKASIKKLMTQPDVLESLNRLEIQGKPVWGLSSDERELIIMARDKVNEC